MEDNECIDLFLPILVQPCGSSRGGGASSSPAWGTSPVAWSRQPPASCRGVATLCSCTQHKQYRRCMLLNVAAHKVRIQSVKVSSVCHITYSITKRTASQTVKCTLHKRFVTVYNLWRCTLCEVYVLKTLCFGTLTLCAATFCNITSCDVYVMLLYVM